MNIFKIALTTFLFSNNAYSQNFNEQLTLHFPERNALKLSILNSEPIPYRCSFKITAEYHVDGVHFGTSYISVPPKIVPVGTFFTLNEIGRKELDEEDIPPGAYYANFNYTKSCEPYNYLTICKDPNSTPEQKKTIYALHNLVYNGDFGGGSFQCDYTYGKLKNETRLTLLTDKIEDLSPIVDFFNLGHISLDNHKIIDLNPLKGLSRQKYLRIKNSKIINIEPIQGLTSLEHLDISENLIEDLTPIKFFNNLQNLIASNNRIQELEPIRNLQQIKQLNLRNNRIQVIEPLHQLYQLSNLNLRNNAIADIAPLSQLTNIKDLDLDANKIEVLDHLELLKNIESLSLVNNSIKSIDSINSNIKSLYIGNNMLTDISGLAKLTNLENLDISQNQITNINTLEQLNKITYLNLRQNQITNIMPLKNTPLSSLYLESNPIFDDLNLRKNPSLCPKNSVSQVLRDFCA